MANSRNYSNTAVSTTLNGAITSGTSVVLNSQTGMPSPPFQLSIEPDTANEEVVLVTSGSGTGGSPYVVTRGQDGTANVNHSNGVTVQHRVTAIDLTDSRTHEAASTGVHLLDSSNLKVAGGNAGITGNIQLTNSSTETTVSKTYTIGANPSAGASYRHYIGGNLACTGTPTLTFRLKYGGTTICTAVITFTSAASSDFHVDAKLEFQVVGGSGQVAGVMSVWAPGVNTTFGLAMPTDAALVSAVSTTSSQAFTISAQWSAPSSSNTLNTVCSSVLQTF